jgi:hypothetical protein
MALRPVLRACAVTTLAAALTATTVFPAAANPLVRPSVPDPAASAAGQPVASEVKGEEQQTIAVSGIDPEALQSPEQKATPSTAPTVEPSTAPTVEPSTAPTVEPSTAPSASPETGQPTPQAAPTRAATASLASMVSLTSAVKAGPTQEQQAQQEVVPVPEGIASKATAETDAKTAPEARELAGTALPAEDAEQVAALTAPAETIDFIVAGVTWNVQDSDQVTEVSVRVREGGTWTDWSSLEIHDGDERPGADRTGTEPLVSTGADAVQARVSTVTGEVPEGLQVDIINPGVADTDGKLNPVSPAPADKQEAGEPTADQAPAALSSTAPSSTAEFVPAMHQQRGLITGTAAAQTVATSADVVKPAIVTRAQWGANESVVQDWGRPASQLKAMYIHHTAGSNNYTQAGAYAQIRGIFSYHAVSLQWGDIGYQFLVDKFGTIYQGRRGSIDAPVQGAQAGGFNTDTIGVSAMGNYDVATAPAAMVKAIERVLAWQAYRYDVDPTATTRLTQSGKGTARWSSGTTVTVPTILGHKVTNFTACPGRYLDAQIPTIRRNVKTLVDRAVRNHGATTQVPGTPSLPANHYTLDSDGVVATGRWNAVSAADGYQVMYRAVPHGGGNITSQPWTAGKTGTDRSTTLSNDPGETAQYAVRAMTNGVPGAQRYLGQHTAPLDWTGSDVYTSGATAVTTSGGTNGRGIRTNGKGSVVRVEGTGQARHLGMAFYVPSNGMADFAVYQNNNRYVGTIRVRSSGSSYCALDLPGGSNVRLVSLGNTPVTLSRMVLTRAGQSQTRSSTAKCQTPFADNAPGSRFYSAVDWMLTEGISSGYTKDNTFRKDRSISRGESVAFVHRYIKPKHTPTSSLPFRDVPSGRTFYRPISWAKDAGIAGGYSNGTFGIARNVTRGEFASFLYRAAKPRFSTPKAKAFSDVATSTSHHAAIAWMKKSGLSGGYTDGTFKPNRSISRGEVAAILHRYHQSR